MLEEDAVVELAGMLADLAAESADADRLVADLPAADWGRMTPAAGWTVAHQIAHLAWTDQAALLAVNDPVAFNGLLEQAVSDPKSFVDRGTEAFLAGVEPGELLDRWRNGRAELAAALAEVPADQRILWYGTAMSSASMVTARIMETWAHGLDVAQALGIE